MSTTVKTRIEIGRLILAKQKFKLRMPGVGIMVRTQYEFGANALPVGTYIGIANISWAEVGQITREKFCKEAKEWVYFVILIGRVHDRHVGLGGLDVNASKISCVFEVVH